MGNIMKTPDLAAFSSQNLAENSNLAL